MTEEQVQRYEFDCKDEDYKDNLGDYVKYEEYSKIESKLYFLELALQDIGSRDDEFPGIKEVTDRVLGMLKKCNFV